MWGAGFDFFSRWLWTNTSLSLHRNGRLFISWGGSKCNWVLPELNIKHQCEWGPSTLIKDVCVMRQQSRGWVPQDEQRKLAHLSWRIFDYTTFPVWFDSSIVLSDQRSAVFRMALPFIQTLLRSWGVPLNYRLVLPRRQREGQERSWTLHKDQYLKKSHEFIIRKQSLTISSMTTATITANFMTTIK